MQIKTLFSLLSAPIDQPLPSVPEGKREILALEMAGPNGTTDVIATLNLTGLALTPERKSSILRLFQLVGAGVKTPDAAITIREMDIAPNLAV